VARLDPLPVEQLSPEQKIVHDKIKGNRPKLGGPFGVLLRNPALATAASGVVDALRTNGKLDKRIYELIVLTVTRHWSAQYAWAVHEPLGLAAGLSADTIKALHERRRPSFAKADEALVYDAVTEILSGKVLSTPLYDGMVKQFGLDTTIEIVATAGLYSMISAVLNGFDVPTPNGERPFKG
jgi:4-carboxymuconolactone decarboxylase